VPKEYVFSKTLTTLIDEANSHSAFNELRTFGEALSEKPLNATELKIFFSSLWAFFEAFPSGILALALRVTDDWATRDPWNATAKGAYVLFADVDEYGLQEVNRKIHRSHHEMFKEFTTGLGVSPEDLVNPEYILPEGRKLGELVSKLYRRESLAKGLGMHLASELVASIEFKYFLNGFQQQRSAYGIASKNDPALTFFRIHTLVEPEHLARNCELIEMYLDNNLINIEDLKNGAQLYLDGFKEFYSKFNAILMKKH
jgi:pyrroloquinoline quinone (PQQ) biosynthesis protein C